MGLASRAFDQQIRGLTPPQVRKSNHQDRGIKRPLTISDVAYRGLQGCFGDLRSTIATDLDAALLVLIPAIAVFALGLVGLLRGNRQAVLAGRS